MKTKEPQETYSITFHKQYLMGLVKKKGRKKAIKAVKEAVKKDLDRITDTAIEIFQNKDIGEEISISDLMKDQKI